MESNVVIQSQFAWCYFIICKIKFEEQNKGVIQTMKVNEDKSQIIPISEKFNLTVSEASVYFNIGRDKLYELAKDNKNDYTLHNGKTILFKRKQLEEFFKTKSYI